MENRYHERVRTIHADFKLIDDEANHGCGLVYELYISRLSRAALHYLSRLSGEDLLIAQTVARNLDCMSEEDMEESEERRERWGLCEHWLEPNLCPCGCGDRDDAKAEISDGSDDQDQEAADDDFVGVRTDCIHNQPIWRCAECLMPYQKRARDNAREASSALLKYLKAERDGLPASWEWTKKALRHAIGIVWDLQFQLDNDAPKIILDRIMHKEDDADILAFKKARQLCDGVSKILSEGYVSISSEDLVF